MDLHRSLLRAFSGQDAESSIDWKVLNRGGVGDVVDPDVVGAVGFARSSAHDRKTVLATIIQRAAEIRQPASGDLDRARQGAPANLP
jgi:hypothetical protein